VNGTRPDPHTNPDGFDQWIADMLESIFKSTEGVHKAFDQHCRDCEGNRKEIWQAITTNKMKIAGWLSAGGIGGAALVALIKWLEC